MGPVIDRTQEHLGSSDRAVVFYRRLILRKIREMDEGLPLPATNPSTISTCAALPSTCPLGNLGSRLLNGWKPESQVQPPRRRRQRSPWNED
jgi:hypothetical protein